MNKSGVGRNEKEVNTRLIGGRGVDGVIHDVRGT